jgi:hypothetical protein
MINNAWAWSVITSLERMRSTENGRPKSSKIILDDQFKFNEAEGFDSEQSTAMAVEVP